MERNAILAIVISLAVLFGWMWWMNQMYPKAERPAVVEGVEMLPGHTESPERALPPPRTVEDETADAGDTTSVDSADVVAAQSEQELRLSNVHFDVLMTNRGGTAKSWKLQNYTTSDGEPLELLPQWESAPQRPLSILIDDPSLSAEINNALFEVEEVSVSDRGGRGPGRRVSFRWSDGRGVEVVKSFTVYETGWIVDIDLDVTDRGRRLPARLVLGPGFGAQEERDSNYTYNGQGVWNDNGNVTRRKPGKMRDAGGSVTGGLLWAGMEDQYFTALVLPGGIPAAASWQPVEVVQPPEEGETSEVTAEPLFAVTVSEAGGALYIGPKKFTMLRDLGNQLEKVVWFSSNALLAGISKWIFLGLIWIHDHVIQNYGVAIILATFLLRLVLFPVNQYSMVNMRKSQGQMQRLQPKTNAIRAKYKKAKDAESRQKMNTEMMELYRKEGVNPMGGIAGCLPLLAQFPILIGFYNMLTVAVELRGAPFFGWITDLAQRDPYYITPLLMGVTMFLQQKMAMSKVKDPAQQQQQKIMMFMPFFFTFICTKMPAGLVLYWFANNLLGIGQQWLVNRHAGRLEAAAQKA